AQGRMSAWIVGSLPLGFLAFLTLLTGPSIVATFATPLGAVLLVVGLGLELGAVVWMRQILAVRA
ncbi:MAG: pilus assembly protein TadB, partial [Actinomycetota bacterium]